jgi:hypothetical protein
LSGEVRRFAQQILPMDLKRHLGHLWNQLAYEIAVGANCQVLMRQNVFQLQSINNWKNSLQQWLRNLKSNEVVVLFGRITIFRHLPGIESKLGLQVRRFVLGIAN